VVANRLGGEPSWWRNVLVAKRPDGESSNGQNDLEWGNQMSGSELSKWRNIHKSLGQFIVARDRPNGEQQIEQKMVQLISETSMGGNQDQRLYA